jgi:ankyrin repeat protein
MASELSQHEAVKILCSYGANAQARTSTDSTPLHIAANSGSSGETIDAIIQNCRVNVDELMSDDTTALYLAAQHGHAHTVKVMIHTYESI